MADESLATVDADVTAHGRFDEDASGCSPEMAISTHRALATLAVMSLIAVGLAGFFARRRS